MRSLGDFDCDVLVVGLGPAGASAAIAAARAGCRVLAVERNAKPGLPVQCAEFVPQMIGGDVPEAGRARVQTIGEMATYVNDAPADITPDFRGYMIDRAGFDQVLVAQAQAAGASCRFATPLRGIDARGVVMLADGQMLGARVIIGADGPSSPVGRAIGCPNTDLAETRQISVDLLQPHEATDIFLRADYVGGYAWLFPKVGECNLGLGVVPAQKHRLKPLLAALHAELIAARRVGARILRTTGGLIPVGGIVGLQGALGQTAVLLAGDAAGLTNPVTGAGIASAVASGRLAGEAAAAICAGQSDAAEGYADEIEAMYGRSLALALRRRRDLLVAPPSPQSLRDGWIAYPQYWAQPSAGRSLRIPDTMTAKARATP